MFWLGLIIGLAIGCGTGYIISALLAANKER